jgi:internalin A
MDWVQEKVQQARTKRWKQLDLGNAGLREVPLEVFDLDALESLVLGRSYYDYDRNTWVKSENQGAANQITLIPGEITRLINLTMLNLSGTQVSDLTPLQGLRTLASLYLSGTQVSDLTPLQGLRTLASLYLSGTQVSDLTPLQGLRTLAELDLSATPIHTFPDFVLALPYLHSLVLYGSPIRDVPPEILGSAAMENCLDAVRSHFADETYGSALDREIKLILLGNGRVGKTSLVKRLVQNDFDSCESSTHGIQLVPWDLLDHEDVLRINIWDFGGQDIYHGTHTLFLRSRVLFLLVWDRDSAQQPGYDADGFHFEHFPLAYWLDYIRDASPESPVIVVENKCDDGTGTSPSVPVPGAQVHFSAKTGSLNL